VTSIRAHRRFGLRLARAAVAAGEQSVDIAAWLHGLGLQQYEQAFRENDVDAEVLPELTADNLISIARASKKSPG
jgi:hypothetical protein